MSLLTIVQAATDRLGLARPVAVFSSNDDQVRILRALAQQEGNELARRGAWQRMVKEHTFTTVAAETQTGAIPSDFDRFVNETVWNYTEREPLIGPLSPAEWQWLKSSQVGPPDLHFRVRGNDFLMVPVPPAGEDIRYEYVSKWWIDADGDGEGESAVWTGDDDLVLLDEDVITLGIIWRFKKRNALPYEDEYNEHETQVAQLLGRDGGKRTLNMAGKRFLENPRYPRVPDGSWNL